MSKGKYFLMLNLAAAMIGGLVVLFLELDEVCAFYNWSTVTFFAVKIPFLIGILVLTFLTGKGGLNRSRWYLLLIILWMPYGWIFQQGMDALNNVLFPEGGEWQPFMSVLTAVEVRILFFTEPLLIFISFEILQAISITMKNGKEK